MTRLLIFTCFFASGACGLAYEVLWTRMLTLVFGTTVYSTSVVLTVFMAGLGLGAALGGRYADRLRNPLRAYGILEVAIGLYCFFTPSLVRGIEALYVGWAVPTAPTAMLALRAGLSFLALIPPTVLMGATLPMLSRFFVERMVGAHSGAYADGGHSPPYAGDAQSAPYRAVGGEVGRLYGINTAGAAFGCFAAGFISVPAFGVTWTVWTAAGLNVVIGLAAIALARGDFGLRISDFGLNGTRNAQYAIRNTEHASPAFADATADQRLASTPPTINHLPSTIVLAAIGLSGFAALAYEVAWTRSLCIVFGTTVYAFSSMLTAFLVGLALGGWLFSWLARGAVRRGGLVGQVGQMETAPLFFTLAELGIGFFVLLTTAFFMQLPDLFLAVYRVFKGTFWAFQLFELAAILLVMLVPTTLMGLTFPLAAALYARDAARVGRGVGAVYFWNTLGAILGSLLTGFALIPWLGAQRAIVLAALVNAAAGLIMLPWLRPRSQVARPLMALALVLACALAMPKWSEWYLSTGVYVNPDDFHAKGKSSGPRERAPQWATKDVLEDYATILSAQTRSTAAVNEAVLKALPDGRGAEQRILYFREGLHGVVCVAVVDGVLTLQINGKTDASTGSDMATQFGLGHFPMLLQPQPPAGSQPAGGSGITCLVIGLGSGVTVGAILSHEVERVDAVEIERGVAEAAELFASANRKALRDPRTRLILDDARNWLLCGRERYDVITSEPSNLWITGVSNLFTIEHYRLCKRRLSPDGVMCQWLHCYQMSEADFKTAIRTFRAAFEHVAVVPASLGDMLMLGTSQPLTPQTLDGLFGRVKACPDFQLIQLDTYADLLRKYTMLTEDVDRYVGPGPLNSDDNALLEFSAPRSLYTSWGAENLFGFLCRR